MGYLGHPKAENIGHVFLNMPYIYNDVGRNTPPPCIRVDPRSLCQTWLRSNDFIKNDISTLESHLDPQRTLKTQ